MKNLIPMTDFVINAYDKIEDSLDSELAMYRYAMFLKKTLELWMFVPCDEDGNVLDKPREFKNKFSTFEQYQQAKERCLFKDFEFSKNDFGDKVVVGDYTCLKVADFKNATIENLIGNTTIQLTETALKQLE